MNTLTSLNLSACNPDNNLWPGFVGKLGPSKAKTAVRQALDLQAMHGSQQTLPVLFQETCGIALISIELLHSQTGFTFDSNRVILLLSMPQKLFQLLYEV